MKAMVQPALYPPPRPQSIGEVLDAGFRLFRATLGHCLPYGALVMIAGELGNLYELFSGRLPSATLELEHDRTWWTWYGVGLAIMLLLWGALLTRQDALARRRPVSMTAELGASLRKFPQLVALTLIAWGGITLGLLLLVVPGLYLAVALAFGAPALFVGGASGPVRALAESLRLVRGEWRRTALLMVLVILITLAVDGVLSAVLTAASAVIADVDVADRMRVASISEIVGVIVGSITAPFWSAMILAIYADLVRRAELRRPMDAGTPDSSGKGAAAGPDERPRIGSDASAGNR
ncbi:MAG: hypothetical protein ACREUT_03825 [Steroidobacteraceae bacterium]